ncbi:MAG TPA: tetratricopeptide repeat protein, partial [Planctomycetota bacterium]|nr:tetratricopeptide repeat protein [Planctomycetota bacterium]
MMTLLTLMALQVDHPLPAAQRERLARELDEAIAKWSAVLELDPRNVDAYSRRGDARFKKGLFKEAVEDYDAMVRLDPSLEKGHWRRGLALYFAGDAARGAKQFEAYHAHDDADRENGLWLFFCRAKARDPHAARQGLLRYQKADRDPLPAVYAVLTGEVKEEDVLPAIESAEREEFEKESRRFYAYLYLGLIRLVDGKTEAALAHLRRAVENRWAPGAGYGPAFM